MGDDGGERRRGRRDEGGRVEDGEKRRMEISTREKKMRFSKLSSNLFSCPASFSALRKTPRKWRRKKWWKQNSVFSNK